MSFTTFDNCMSLYIYDIGWNQDLQASKHAAREPGFDSDTE